MIGSAGGFLAMGESLNARGTGGFVVPRRLGNLEGVGNAFLGIPGPKTQDMGRLQPDVHKIWDKTHRDERDERDGKRRQQST
jgi:hypothetical protein